MDVKEQEDRGGMRACDGNCGGDSSPRAQGADHVLDGVLVPCIEVSSGRKVLPMMMFMNQGIHGRHMEKVMAWRVAYVQNDKHYVQRSKRVRQPQIIERLRYLSCMPQVVTQTLNEYPFVQRIYRKKNERQSIQGNVSNGLAGGSGRQEFGI